MRVNNDPDRLVDDIRKVDDATVCQFMDGALAVAERAPGLPERSISIIAVIDHPAATRPRRDPRRDAARRRPRLRL
ncbi:hypothetical protein GCM10007886_37030 [Methylobacterium gregans]|uniref:hypothetical protein n=1 Tax=Methylobacterium gregans TaxID=374424 RepID=UPI001EE388B4|nr:hypothetical protein [Methylobacterium gregans]MDQ0523604.1 hypothetical protein [Methylobacterium gregans]GLS55518.1 hypothetical protein GCM10007886_37030 [Methylobacterium gregans]